MVLIFLMAAYLHDKHHLQVSCKCWKLHRCVWGEQMIKGTSTLSCLYFFHSVFLSVLFFFFFSSPTLNYPRMGNTLPARAAHQTPRQHLHLHRADGGLRLVSCHSALFIADAQRWSKDKLSATTMSLTGWLTFCIPTKSEKSSRAQPEVNPAGP